MIFQLHNLLPHLDAEQNVEVVMMGSKLHRRQRRRVRGRSSPRFGSTVESTFALPSCRAASGNASRSRGRSPTIRS